MNNVWARSGVVSDFPRFSAHNLSSACCNALLQPVHLSLVGSVSLPSSYDFIQSPLHAPQSPLVSSLGCRPVSVRAATSLPPAPQTQAPSTPLRATPQHNTTVHTLPQCPELLLALAYQIFRAHPLVLAKLRSHGD